MRSLKNAVVFVIVAWLTGCIEPYDPPLADEDIDFLVVEGFLNGSDGTATVVLSRTIPVKSTDQPPRETGAVVYLEDAQGQVFTLAEGPPGSYFGTVPGAAPLQTYRLVVRTGDEHEYVSSYTEVVESPPIDSISWSIETDGVRFEVNTHDPEGRAKFFKWGFSETYEYHSKLYSRYKFNAERVVVPREMGDDLTFCWRSIDSREINIGSVEHLERSIVSRHPVTYVPYGSAKLSVKYSILVKQQALTEETHEYWRSLEKSTEDLGGLFDPLPTEVSGNISCVNHPGEKALGLFSASTLTEKRFFLSRAALPPEISGLYSDRTYCPLDTILMGDLESAHAETLFIDEIYGLGPDPIGYSSAPRPCGDCTYFGGTTIKPSFWE